MDAKSEARKIAFDRTGKGDKALLISGFPQTRRIIAVGTGNRLPDGPVYSIFEVL